MTYKAIFKSWKELTIEDLLVAYRKAKVDCFFEDTFPTAVKFAEYEENLLQNLENLLDSLKVNEGFLKDESLIGQYRVVPKKISLTRKSGTTNNGHVHFSDPQKVLSKLFEENAVCAAFRIIGDFPVNTHIISALWINMIGEKFDEKLTESCYGARLKRIESNDNFLLSKNKVFHITAIGSFQPYFQPYQKWRSDGLNAIRTELEKDKSVIAVSLDLKSYYHYIDPQVISSKELHLFCGITLSDPEYLFTKQLADFLEAWSKGSIEFSQKISTDCKEISGGLVIGLTVSRIISNMILNKWDSLINEKVSPIHYGRYIDDMFLVIRDTGKIKNSKDLMEVLRERIAGDVLKNDEGDPTIWEINQNFSKEDKTKIKLQSDKQKLFILNGRVGLDLLDSIEKDIHDLSSEHRLMPSPDQLDKSTAAKVLSAAGVVGQSADTLRRADGLTLRRLSWALQLRHVETFAKDLPPNAWKEQRNEFYQFAHNHILRADSIFEHFKYLPRLLGFAINLNEWEQAKKILLKAYEALDCLKIQVQESSLGEINGAECKLNENIWKHVKCSLTILFINAAVRYLNFGSFSSHEGSYHSKISKIFFDRLLETINSTEDLLSIDFSITCFYGNSYLVAKSDLAKTPYKEILKLKSIDGLFSNSLEKNQQIQNKFKNLDLIQFNSLERFLNSTCEKRLKNVNVDKQKFESYFPYLFPTRPYTATEISELAPECVGLPNNKGKLCEDKPALIWAKYTQAIRGVWIKPTLLAIESDCIESIKNQSTESTFLHIGTEKRDKVIVALTNFRTDEKDWGCSASDKPNLTLDRYQRISDLVNDALKLKPRPDYVIFPELSIPLEWLDSIASRFCSLGISLIAGTEYRHFESNKLISEAVLVLSDNRLGYPSHVKIWQPKLEPAVNEERTLISIHGKEWNFDITEFHLRKPIYVHHGFHFGVMVCSELQNSKARIDFQDKVDAITVLSWNQDLDTFSSLMESAALDIHAYTILVNNRAYGDSRVRSPAKLPFNRDIARVRGGENDFTIAATLNINELRVFQSRMKRWPQDGDKFKPVPEGFEITRSRRKLPPI